MPIARTLAHLEPLNALGYIWYVMYFSKETSNGASLNVKPTLQSTDPFYIEDKPLTKTRGPIQTINLGNGSSENSH